MSLIKSVVEYLPEFPIRSASLHLTWLESLCKEALLCSKIINTGYGLLEVYSTSVVSIYEFNNYYHQTL